MRTGFAAPATEELADTITIGEYLIRHKESTYLMKVEGDGMASEGLLDGDMVLFERRIDAKRGDIVIVLDEAGYRLVPLSKRLVGQIIGVVTASFRTYAAF